jgi:DNA polymerase/3'-5' exonuclease PolX
MPPKKKQKVSPPYPPVPKTVLDKIMSVCCEVDKPSRQAIQKALATKYNYTNQQAINSALTQGVKIGKLIQKGQSFYTPGSEPSEYEPEQEKWTPLPADDKHAPGDGMNGMNSNISNGFPEQRIDCIRLAENRSFWKFAFHLQEMCYLYQQTGDDSRAGSFQEALDNMLDLSEHNYEHYNKDKYGNIIGIGHEDMGTDMVKNDVKCLRDIYGVGASTVKLIEEWIETGTMKRLEDLRKEATPSITEWVRHKLNGEDEDEEEEEEEEEFEEKKDCIPGFLKALGELADLYKKEDDFRATAMRRAVIALEGQIISAVEDIKLFRLAELKGVGKSTLEMLTEFIETGKIKKLEEMRPKYNYIPGFLKLMEIARDDGKETSEFGYNVFERMKMYRRDVYCVKDIDTLKGLFKSRNISKTFGRIEKGDW